MDIQDFRQSIMDDMENGLEVEILNDTGDSVTVFDSTEMSREYTLVDPSVVVPSWILNRIIETPSAAALPYRVNLGDLATYISSHVDPVFLSSLSQIIIVGNTDDDTEYLRSLSYELYRALEESELPYDELGMNWWSCCKIIIHMGNIVSDVNDMVENLEIDEWDVPVEINYAVLTTALHEIRHLAQGNPYIPEDVLCQSSDDEDDAENYARSTVEMNPPMVVYEC